MAGYSGTPLPKKLGIREDHTILILQSPPGFPRVLGELSPGVTVRKDLRGKGPYDVIVFFTRRRAELERRFPALDSRLNPDGGLWIAWPKKASGVETDVTEDVVREVALANGLVDNKVCAIDDTWSGLRLVVRLADRPGRRAAPSR